MLIGTAVDQVHEKIRENPIAEKKERTKPESTKKWKPTKITYEERKERLKVCQPTSYSRE